MRSICTLLLSIMMLSAHAKDYTRYYKLINSAEEAFISRDNGKAYELYDKAFKAYDKPFLKDCYIAAQVAYAGGDTAKFLQYMALAFRNGMPLSAYPAAKILRSSMDNEQLYGKIKELHEKNFRKFNPDIEQADELELISYTADSLKNLAHNDTAIIMEFIACEKRYRDYIDEHYLAKGTFPSEKIFGVTTEESRIEFRERNKKEPLFEKMVLGSSGLSKGKDTTVKVTFQAIPEEYALDYTTGLNVFIHYTCTWQEYKDKLWSAVVNGYLHPKEFGLLYETSVLWNRTRPIHLLNKICDYPEQPAYFNILYKDPFSKFQTYRDDPESLKVVEANREKYLMQKFSVDIEKKKLEKEYGFKLFFGFMNVS